MPGHPDAGPDGYVAFPRINPAEDMVDLMSASRDYQANVAAIASVKDMIQRSIDITALAMSTTILPVRSPSLPTIDALPSFKSAGNTAPSSFDDLSQC